MYRTFRESLLELARDPLHAVPDRLHWLPRRVEKGHVREIIQYAGVPPDYRCFSCSRRVFNKPSEVLAVQNIVHAVDRVLGCPLADGNLDEMQPDPVNLDIFFIHS